MFRFLLPLLFLAAPLTAQTTCGGGEPFTILHFTETAGFDHRTREESADMFTAIGAAENFTIVDTRDLSAFDDLSTLLAYEVIVFSNTSGNIPFTGQQRANLESYVEAGGAALGIHAATDMYRDGSFPFFTRLMGGSRRNSPAHTSSSFVGTMDVIGDHPSTANVPTEWTKQEEYYYWPDTGLVDGITEVLRVRSTGTNSYDAARPMSWYQEFDSGGRSFYTALGHGTFNYTDADNDFRRHLRDALCWAVEAGTAVLPIAVSDLRLDRETEDRITATFAGELPTRVTLYGGHDRDDVTALGTDLRPGYATTLTHVPTDPARWFYYRLRFLDADGLASWSDWLAAPPRETGAAAQVLYDGTEARLVTSGTSPAAAWITDATGRTVARLRLEAGATPLPRLTPGMYYIRFPFSRRVVRYLAR